MRTIKREVIVENIKTILKTNDLILVVKDDAYGFGLNFLVDIGLSLNLHKYAVKSIEEAQIVRNADREALILLLGKMPFSQVLEIKKLNLTVTINDFDDYLFCKEHKLKAHLAIDTGMNRFGMKEGYLAVINDRLIKSIYTHLASIENLAGINQLQDLALRYKKDCHIGGSLAYGHTTSTLRIGRKIYENALGLYGQIVNIKKVTKGEKVGYGGDFQALQDCLIAICDIGYSSGLCLHYSGYVSINKKTYRCVGRTCMDHTFILVDSDVKVGDSVEFFGEKISEDEFARNNNLTKYQLFLQVNKG